MPGAFGMMDQLPTTINQRDTVCAIGTSSKGKRPLRALSASDKIDAIQRVNDGESKASVARDIGVPESTLRGWCKNEDKLRYMSSRHSTPETDKSEDGLCEDKRVKYDLSAAALNYSQNGGLSSAYDMGADLSMHGAPDRTCLDLSRVKKEDSDMKASDMMHADFSSYTRSTLDLNKTKNDLNKYASDLGSSMLHKDSKHKLDSGASMSMSAISPLSGLNHLSGLSGLGQSHLGLSFNEIATNLSLIAQLNPSLSALTNSINSSAKALRSIRSPKPSHNSSGGTGLMPEKHKSSKSHHHSDPYHEKSRTSRSSHSSYKDTPVDDTLWYWLKKQQAMLNMTGTPSTVNPLSMSQHTVPSSRSGKDSHSTHSAKATAALPSIVPPMDALNKNSWFWQYYKQFTGNLGLPDDKAKIPPQVKQESYENILYSHLMKEKAEPSPPKEAAMETNAQQENLQDKVEEFPVKECYTPPPRDKVDKESSKNSTRARAVLDNLLFNNNNNVAVVETTDLENGEKDSNAENVFGCEVNEALEHGEKFLKWLEACQEPSVTRMQVHQLKGMLSNIKANADRRNQNSSIKDKVSRRK